MKRRLLVAASTALLSLTTATLGALVAPRSPEAASLKSEARTATGRLTAKAAGTAPRTPWGDPRLQGIWPGTAMMGVPTECPAQFGERRFLSDDEFAARQAQATR